jgi:formylmethanofuran dehydrogenase subunit E
MIRFLGILLLLVILWLAVKSFSAQLKAAVFGPAPAPKSPLPRAAVAETLVRCAACGTYIVPSRAVKGRGDEVFCSEGCRKAGVG